MHEAIVACSVTPNTMHAAQHSMMGITIAVMTLIHTVFHVLRWSERDEADMLVNTRVGVSGAIAALTIIPIVPLLPQSHRVSPRLPHLQSNSEVNETNICGQNYIS